MIRGDNVNAAMPRQVRRLHGSPGELVRTPCKSPVSAEQVYPGVHPAQLLDDPQPVLVDVLRNNSAPKA